MIPNKVLFSVFWFITRFIYMKGNLDLSVYSRKQQVLMLTSRRNTRDRENISSGLLPHYARSLWRTQKSIVPTTFALCRSECQHL